MKQFRINSSLKTQHSDALGALLCTARKYPPLTTEQEQKADPEKLIKHNILFVISVAKKYNHNGVVFMDLVNEGLVGLTKAAYKYNPALGFRFISYAVSRISSEIITFIDSKRDVIRTPRKISRASYRIKNLKKGEETDIETASRLGIDTYYATHHRVDCNSLDLTNDDGDNIFEAVGEYQTDSDLLNDDLKRKVKFALSKLSSRERNIIELRYFSDCNYSLEHIGDSFGVSAERIRQLEVIALKKLRIYLLDLN